jgi:hypothetical protein
VVPFHAFSCNLLVQDIVYTIEMLGSLIRGYDAVAWLRVQVVRKLVSDHGADLNAVDGRGKTAFDLLAVKGRCAHMAQSHAQV